MHDQMRDILFIRTYPKNITIAPSHRNVLKSIIRRQGVTIAYGRHNITFLYPGIGKLQKKPSPNIIDQINSGLITDVIDIGGGGALDPALKRGDLVLSSEDIPYDTKIPAKVKRRPEMKDIVRRLAEQYNSRFYEGKILTSPHVIIKREARRSVHNMTGCLVVQMEHCWFVRKLQRYVNDTAFKNLYFTHIEVVSDEVPKNDSLSNRMFELYYALKYCLLFNQIYLGSIKRDFLKLCLK